MKYTIAKLKTFTGMEGQGFNADLLHEGRKVAFVIDDACGGPLMFHWASDADKVMLDAYAATLPAETTIYASGPFTSQPDAETVVNDLINLHLNAKRLKRSLKNKVMMLCADGQIRELTKVKPTADIIARAIAKYTDAKVLNVLPFEQALDLYMAVTA